MQIEYTEHGIRRVIERRRIFTRSNAMILIHLAWRDGIVADYDLFDDQWMDHIYLYYDGLVYVFQQDSPFEAPIHKTVLFLKGQTQWQVRAA